MKIHSHLRNLVRCSIATGRFADRCNERIADAQNSEKKVVNMIFFSDTGKQCTIAGMGPIFENFLQTGDLNLKDLTGFGTSPATSTQEHFDEASFRIMNFADTYGNVHADFSKCKIAFHFSFD